MIFNKTIKCKLAPFSKNLYHHLFSGRCCGSIINGGGIHLAFQSVCTVRQHRDCHSVNESRPCALIVK